MAECTIQDLFGAFQRFWSEAADLPAGEQVDRWATVYMADHGELLGKQLDNYAAMGGDWRRVATERVFSDLAGRMDAMNIARTNLLEVLPATYRQSVDLLGFDCPVLFVIYVGIGCGAGWATELAGGPAVLHGLEKIAECGWIDRPSLTSLAAHELGHVAHFHWRHLAGKAHGDGAFWDLYTEGFAQRCEHSVQGRDSWHQSKGVNPPGWTRWCADHLPWLAAEFLRRTEARQPVNVFFGDWFQLRGWKQCGYFLGHEFIRAMAQELSLSDIALLDDWEPRLHKWLSRIAQ